MYLFKDDLPDKIEIRTFKDFQFTFCHNYYELGILIYAKGRTYYAESFDNSGCNTFFKFRNKRFFIHHVDEIEEVPIPEWVKKWVIKNDFY